MSRLFLYKVYLYNKKLFIFFVAFTVFTVVVNLAGNEITPFFVWGMYSENEVPQDNYEIFKVTANDYIIDYTTGYLPANRFFLLSPLSYYSEMKNSGDPTKKFLERKLKKYFSEVQPYASKVLNSRKEVEKFPFWYKRYLQQTTGEIIKNYKIEIIKVSYDINNSIKTNSSYTLIDGR